MAQPKTMEQISQEYRDTQVAFKAAEKEFNAAIASETKALLPLIGAKIIDAKFYSENEGVYVLTLDNGKTVSFSAQGDDATYVTADISK